MQIVKNLKHILVVTIVTFLTIFWVLRFFGAGLSTAITHFFVYREEVAPLDWLYKYNFSPSVKDIVIIKIDDRTLNDLQVKSDLKFLALDKWIYTKLITNLESVGVKGIAFDIVFQNIDPTEDEFASVLSKYPNVVIATTTWEKMKCALKKDDSNSQGERYDLKGNPCVLNRDGIYESMSWSCIDDKNGNGKTCDGVPRFLYKDARWWDIALGKWNDNKVPLVDITDSPFSSWRQSKELETLALALYKTSIGTDVIPFKLGEKVLTPFFWKADIYPSISLSDVLSMSKVDLISNFAGKYVFVGESGWLIHDAHVSPVTGDIMDGVEFHAHFLDGILQNRYMKAYNITNGIFIIVLFFLVLISVTIYYLFSSRYVSIGIAIGITLWIIWMSRYAYFVHGIVLEIFPILLAGSMLSFPFSFIYRFFIVDREKRMLRSAFSHYVDPELVREISDASSTIKLWGETKELSILFSDIAGFTTISEKTPVKDLFYLMSSYLSCMTDILTANWWTLDKYIGDAVMGFFGAPIPKADHARRACQTALDMRAALPKFNAELLARWLEAIDFRVWIGSGEVMVGNIGSKDRFNYTVLWDTVNLASRLEATSKEYGTHIIVSEATYLIAKEYFRFRKLDLITVKWKNDPVGIYELIADIRDNTIDAKKYDEYERGLSFYAKWEYLLAGQIWESQIEQDPPSRIMAHRCLEILKGDLIVENGVYHMTKK